MIFAEFTEFNELRQSLKVGSLSPVRCLFSVVPGSRFRPRGSRKMYLPLLLLGTCLLLDRQWLWLLQVGNG